MRVAAVRGATRWAAAVLACAVGLLLAVPAPAGAIADAEDVPDGSYGFTVSLEARGIQQSDGVVRDSGCSGALVAPQWIVTAGHCFHDGDRNRVGGPPRYEVTAILGRATRSGPGGVEVPVVDVLQSPVSDLAVARLARPVPEVAPVRVARVAPRALDTLRLTGWGATTSPAVLADRSERMQTGLFQVTAVADTTIQVRGLAPSPTTSPCPFDSGAPFFVEEPGQAPRLVAVEVGGPACPHAEEDTAARIDAPAVARWLAQVLANRPA